MSSYSSTDESYDSDEPPELELDLDKLMGCASFQEATTAPRSLANPGFCCIARFTRGDSSSAKSLSEIATARYLKRFTEIPVPEIYYHDLEPDNNVGAPFVLMEKMPGRQLRLMWDDLSLEGKKSALSQVASVIAQLASLKFDRIGSLHHAEPGVGPLISPCLEHPKGPFQSVEEYLRSFVPAESVETPELKGLFGQIQEELGRFLALHRHAAYLQPPFCLIHADFDGQNMLFLEAEEGGSGPRLVGLIDFEYAYTGPLHFLYEYPIFIQDVHWFKELYAENAILRAHFVKAIYEALPTSDARSTFIASMNGKNFILRDFQHSFMMIKFSEKDLIHTATYYLQDLRDGTGLAYSGRLDYTPELYTETGEPLPSDTTAEREVSHSPHIPLHISRTPASSVETIPCGH
ncbi:kinase-like domain-containing protein [Chaetomium tenue]|uniref:Kinase-like domain-containing protein n=1 Tax=Chaetomium tenue TaxID=1854479 RepID=A0ACB7P3E9_9PEZI|nr:kinase-like domain-containing protein [Chaetomium globosum]